MHPSKHNYDLVTTFRNQVTNEEQRISEAWADYVGKTSGPMTPQAILDVTELTPEQAVSVSMHEQLHHDEYIKSLEPLRDEPVGGWRKSLVAFSITANLTGLDMHPTWPAIIKREHYYALAASMAQEAFVMGRTTGKTPAPQAISQWLDRLQALNHGN